MIYAIHCLDHPDETHIRLSNYDAHKCYLSEAAIRTVLSGSLLDFDGETMIGSLFVVEAANLEEVCAFNKADPFQRAGLWAQVDIHGFHMRVDNRLQNSEGY